MHIGMFAMIGKCGRRKLAAGIAVDTTRIDKEGPVHVFEDAERAIGHLSRIAQAFLRVVYRF